MTELEEQSKSRDIWYRRRYQSEWLTLRVEGKRRWWRRSLPKDTSIHGRFPEASLCLFEEHACHDHQDHHQKQEVRVPVHLYGNDDVADVYQYRSLSDSMTLNRQSFPVGIPSTKDVYLNQMMSVNLIVSSFILFASCRSLIKTNSRDEETNFIGHETCDEHVCRLYSFLSDITMSMWDTLLFLLHRNPDSTGI